MWQETAPPESAEHLYPELTERIQCTWDKYLHYTFCFIIYRAETKIVMCLHVQPELIEAFSWRDLW